MRGGAVPSLPSARHARPPFPDLIELLAAALLGRIDNALDPAIRSAASRARAEASAAIAAGRASAGHELRLGCTLLYEGVKDRARRGPQPPGGGAVWRRAARTLGLLRHRQRSIVALHCIGAMPLSDTAAVVGVSETEAAKLLEAALLHAAGETWSIRELRAALREAGGRLIAPPPVNARAVEGRAAHPRPVVTRLLSPVPDLPTDEHEGISGLEGAAPTHREASITAAILESWESEEPDLVPAARPGRRIAAVRTELPAVPPRDRPPAPAPSGKAWAWIAVATLVVTVALVPALGDDAGAPGTEAQVGPGAPVVAGGQLPNAPPAVDAAPAASAAPAVDAAPPVVSAPVDATPAAVVAGRRSVRVARGDSLWKIAEERLGDPLRWRAIWRLNKGRLMTTGERFTRAELIRPGWQLRLPRGAATG